MVKIKRNNVTGQWAKGNNSGKRFTSENSRGNKNAKGNPPNKTSFTKGKFAGKNHPQWKGGIQNMKKDVIYISTDANKRVRRPKIVWESVYGELPQGYVLWHKDRDMHNDDIDNLEAITRAEMLQRNKNST